MNPSRSIPVLLSVAAAFVVAPFAAAAAVRASTPAIPSTADGSIFVNLQIQKRELYVGESVPVVIEVGARDDVVASLDNPPSLRGDAFTLNVLAADPDREQRVIDGKPCTLLAWHSLLAAVKPGRLSLTIEAPLTVRVPLQQRRESTFVDEAAAGDASSDPAFEGLLQSTTEQAVVASSDTMTFQVLALPTADQPAGFSGAVGKFNISSELSRKRTVVGEPLTVRMRVLGAGNFDRVSSSMLGEVKDWKVYRPTARFTPIENSGYRGEKLFEQSVVATASGFRSLPGLTFSYFDPETRRYETARAAPLGIDVAPGAATTGAAAQDAAAQDPTASGAAAPGTAHDSSTAGAVPPGTQPPSAGTPNAAFVRGDHAGQGPTSQSLVPLYLQPRFLSVPALLLVAFTAVWFRRQNRDPVAKNATPLSDTAAPSTDTLMLQMEQAAAAGDVRLFFRSASRVLRSAGAVEPEAEVHDLLLLADEANYAGEMPRETDLQRLRSMVLRHLKTRIRA